MVIVATLRALKYHGGVEVKDVSKENLVAVEKGIVNLERHINNVRNNYGLPCIVAINHRTHDTDAELKLLVERIAHHGAKIVVARHWADGGKGAVELAEEVVKMCETPNNFKFVYEESATLWDKMKTIATKIYGASDITADSKVRSQIKRRTRVVGLFPNEQSLLRLVTGVLIEISETWETGKASDILI